jgi:hypothetical protein
MTNDHPLLTAIREALQVTGTHLHHWGELRREVFPGETAWTALKAWCADNQFACDLAYSQSSKGTQVQFRKLTKAAAAAAAAAIADPA